jgi:hypothetical protein
MNRKAIITLSLGALVLSACGPGYATPTPEPTPTPLPTPQVIVVDSADEIQAVFDGLDAIQVDELVQALADAGRADTKTAHTSELGQLVEDIAPALPWVALAFFFLCCTVVALALLATWRAERKRQSLQALDSRLADISLSLESVTPRNTQGENDSEQE